MEADGEEAERGGCAQHARSVVMQIAPQAACKCLTHAETITASLDLPVFLKRARTQIRLATNPGAKQQLVLDVKKKTKTTRLEALIGGPLPETPGLSYQRSPERSGSGEGNVCRTAPAPLTGATRSRGTFPTHTRPRARQTERSPGTEPKRFERVEKCMVTGSLKHVERQYSPHSFPGWG